MRAESFQSTQEEKVAAYEMISSTINVWMQEAIQASQEGHQVMLSSTIRVSHLIDCLIHGLCGNTFQPNSVDQNTIVICTQDNLCSLAQLVPDAFEFSSLGQNKLRQLCAQLLQNVTANDELISQPANVLLNIFQSKYQADQLVPLVLEILEDHSRVLRNEPVNPQLCWNAIISSLEMLMVLLKDTI